MTFFLNATLQVINPYGPRVFSKNHQNCIDIISRNIAPFSMILMKYETSQCSTSLGTHSDVYLSIPTFFWVFEVTFSFLILCCHGWPGWIKGEATKLSKIFLNGEISIIWKFEKFIWRNAWAFQQIRTIFLFWKKFEIHDYC